MNEATSIREVDANPERPGASGDVHHLAEHLFREESGKLVSVLTGLFGVERLQLAEDVVQEALVRALRLWPYQGVPRNPAAWLTQTAKNLALDVVRRERRFQEKMPAIVGFFHDRLPARNSESDLPSDQEIQDARLRLMFVCCHPRLTPKSQIALALKTLCGFGCGEIAHAFLTTEAAMAKRLTRARQEVQQAKIRFVIPTGPALGERLEGVLKTLYLLFNEGYKASRGDDLVREDLCREAIRLTLLLAEHPVGQQPRIHALAALMLLTAARLPSRVDCEGNLLLLRDQDRSLWNRSMMAQGFAYMAKSGAGREISEYHIQAGIAACHCAAKDYASTDWPRILSLYDQLVLRHGNPVVELNRAVAVAQVHGPLKGLEAIAAIRQSNTLHSYALYYAVQAEFQAALGEYDAAVKHLQQAMRCTEVPSERAMLTRRMEEYRQTR